MSDAPLSNLSPAAQTAIAAGGTKTPAPSPTPGQSAGGPVADCLSDRPVTLQPVEMLGLREQFRLVEIARLMFPDRTFSPLAGDYHCPVYTTSIDAALTLVPEGNWWEVGKMTDENSPMRNFTGRTGLYTARTHRSYGAAGHGGYHDNPAIALCIAALKSRDSQ